MEEKRITAHYGARPSLVMSRLGLRPVIRPRVLHEGASFTLRYDPDDDEGLRVELPVEGISQALLELKGFLTERKLRFMGISVPTWSFETMEDREAMTGLGFERIAPSRWILYAPPFNP